MSSPLNSLDQNISFGEEKEMPNRVCVRERRKSSELRNQPTNDDEESSNTDEIEQASLMPEKALKILSSQKFWIDYISRESLRMRN